jgi:hypothetical protein
MIGLGQVSIGNLIAEGTIIGVLSRLYRGDQGGSAMAC